MHSFWPNRKRRGRQLNPLCTDYGEIAYADPLGRASCQCRVPVLDPLRTASARTPGTYRVFSCGTRARHHFLPQKSTSPTTDGQAGDRKCARTWNGPKIVTTTAAANSDLAVVKMRKRLGYPFTALKSIVATFQNVLGSFPAVYNGEVSLDPSF